MKKYVVRRPRGSHTVFTFPVVPSVKGSGWAWSPTPAGGVAARPSWHEPRAVLAGTFTYGARIGIPESVARIGIPASSADDEHLSMLRAEAVERVGDALMSGAQDAVSRFVSGYTGGSEPACLVCVVGEPLTVVGFNEDARLGKLPESQASGRVGFDVVCEVGFHAYNEVPIELADAPEVVVFPFEGDLGSKSVWDAVAAAYGVKASPFRWVDGKREWDEAGTRAWFSALFPATEVERLIFDGVGGQALRARLQVRVRLAGRGECLGPPCEPSSFEVGTDTGFGNLRVSVSDPEHVVGCPAGTRTGLEERAAFRLLYPRLKGMGLPVLDKPPESRAYAFYLVDDLDADPFFPVRGSLG